MEHFNKHRSTILLFCILFLSFLVRFLWLDVMPPSLYTDEANQGYNAYSLLQTGRDEHGKFFPVSLRSFGDWKPPLPTYIMMPFVWLFGLNPRSVRLPSMLLGIGTIVLSFSLARMLFPMSGRSTRIGLLTAFFLAISPWHIMQSRMAMLVIVSLFFLMLGIYFFLKGRRHGWFLPWSAIAFILSIYSYYGMRLIIPLLLISLFFLFWKDVLDKKSALLQSVCFGVLLLLPLAIQFFKEPDVVFGRAKTVSIFYDKGISLRQWELITQDGISYPSFLARFFHNRVYLYGRDIVRRFLSHFHGDFLFFFGDRAQPFQIPNMGILYGIDGLLFIPALLFLQKHWNASGKLIVFLLCISFLPAALTFMTPASNRTFTAVFPLMLFSSLGIISFGWRQFSRPLFAGCVSILCLMSFAYFLFQYFLVLPKEHAEWWNFGWKEVAEYVDTVEHQYESIIIFESGGMPYIYTLFYGKTHPQVYQEGAVRTHVPDQFGFEHVEGFGKYLFPTDWDWKEIKKNPQPHTLYVISGQAAQEDINYTKIFYYPNGTIMAKVFAYE